MKQEVMRVRPLAEALYAYAEAHYDEGGMDVLVECFTVDMIEQEMLNMGRGRPRTLSGALKAFPFDVWAETPADVWTEGAI